MSSKWFYWDFHLWKTEYDKGAHLTYPFFLTMILSTIGIALRLPWHVVRVVTIGMIIICILWEFGELIQKKDKVSGGDLICDGIGIALAGWCIHIIEKLP